MNHRTFKVLAAAGTLLVLAAAGCTNTTEQPKSTVTAANIFNDPNAYQQLLARVYAGLAISGQQGPAGNPDIQGIDEGFSQYLRLYWECEELPTDAAVIAWGDIGLPEMNTMTWTSSSRMVVAMYYRIELQATMANEFLRQTTDAVLASRNVSTPLKAQIHTWRMEARFLRALSYWHGLDLFGNIPLVTENDPIGGAPPKQAKRADIYAFVVAELNAIKDSLPTWGAANLGRANQAAAHMLLAELYLNAGVYTGTANWTGALTEASAVIATPGLALDPSWRHIFEANNQNSSEVIFPVESNGSYTQTYGGVTFIAHAGCGGFMQASWYGIDYCWGGTRLKQQAYNLFSPGDGRYSFVYDSLAEKDSTAAQRSRDSISIGPDTAYSSGINSLCPGAKGCTAKWTSVDSTMSNSVTQISNYQNGAAYPKFTNLTSLGAAGSNPTFVDTWFPMFRLSEAYLIYAEANLQGGGGSQAIALGYVNALRERAYGGATGDITGAQLTLPFILAERGRELMWEAHRRTDLVRFGEFTGNSYLWAFKGGVVGGAGTDAHYNLYPLPATELVANPNLTQNPGY